MPEYKVKVLTGNERLDVKSRKKRVPMSIAVMPLKNGKPIFIQGMRRSTAYDFKTKLEKALLKEIDIEHVACEFSMSEGF